MKKVIDTIFGFLMATTYYGIIWGIVFAIGGYWVIRPIVEEQKQLRVVLNQQSNEWRYENDQLYDVINSRLNHIQDLLEPKSEASKFADELDEEAKD